MIKETPYEEGFTAWAADLTEADNPYVNTSPSYLEWRRGWLDAAHASFKQLKTENIVQVAKELLKQQRHKDALEKLKDA